MNEVNTLIRIWYNDSPHKSLPPGRECRTRNCLANCKSGGKEQGAVARALLATLLFDYIHHSLLSTMIPRKRARTNHAHDGAIHTSDFTAGAIAISEIVKTVTRATTSISTTTPKGEPLISVAQTAVKLRRGCLKEIPNFAVEIQLMVCLTLTPYSSDFKFLIMRLLDLRELTPSRSFKSVSYIQDIPQLLFASEQRGALGGGCEECRRLA